MLRPLLAATVIVSLAGALGPEVRAATCGSPSSIHTSGCATKGYASTAPDIAHANQYLSPSLGAGRPTCTANSLAEFKACITGRLSPGSIVEVSNTQAWDSPGSITITGEGTSDRPVTVRTKHVGAVTIRGKANFAVHGQWVRFEGFTFSGPEATNSYGSAIDIGNNVSKTCNHCLIDGVTLAGYDHNNHSSFSQIVSWGSWNRIAYNRLDGRGPAIGTTVAIDNAYSDAPDDVQIDHNYFANRPNSGASSGYETIVVGNGWEVGQSPPYGSYRYSGCVIHDNLFYKLNGSVAVVSFKSGGCILRNNTFLQSGKAVASMRESDGNLIEGNIVDGGNVPGTGGVLVRGDGHVIVHNIFQNLAPDTSSEDELASLPIAVYGGDMTWPTALTRARTIALYKPSTNAVIAFNTFAASNPTSSHDEWMVGTPATNTASGTTTEPTGITFAGNVIGNGSNIGVLAEAPGSVVNTSGNLCSPGITDKVCAGPVTVTANAAGIYQPHDANDPAIYPTRAATYASLGIPSGMISKMYWITGSPTTPIGYKYLTNADVGPRAW